MRIHVNSKGSHLNYEIFLLLATLDEAHNAT